MSEKLTVTLKTPTGMILEKTAIPKNYTVDQAVHNMVTHFNLPLENENGIIEYFLVRENHSDAPLPRKSTLADAGVQDADILRLQSSQPVHVVDSPEKIPVDQSPADSQIEVLLSLPDFRTSREKFMLDETIEDLIKSIAKKHSLTPPDRLQGEGSVYQMRSKARGAELNAWETLRRAQVPHGDQLLLAKIAIAGGRR